MEYRPQCIERECIEFTEYQPQCTLKRGLQNPQNMNHHALKGDLYNSQEERPDTCKLPRTMTDMISIVWLETPCSNPASCVAYKEHCMLIVYTCYPAWDTRVGVYTNQQFVLNLKQRLLAICIGGRQLGNF